ncbi:crossover junction endodeoxyribonuclease RuvC, partial [Bifidobacterium pseudocatenulatum]|nr:crossover junction endodeoxyribonuclease RuvC [Bifidobacterium pseudocatenulatum]
MIILGVDPGLPRCGVGVIEAGAYRRRCFFDVVVVRCDPKMSQD